jgi:hypothetical protein
MNYLGFVLIGIGVVLFIFILGAIAGRLILINNFQNFKTKSF